MMYGLARSTWPNGEFAKNYPEEKEYRHSLKEEAAAMRSAIKVLKEKKIKDLNSIDKSLQLIMKLDTEGLLESFILLAMPDEGIAKDFVAYRHTNVENLRRYVHDYVITGGAGPKKLLAPKLIQQTLPRAGRWRWRWLSRKFFITHRGVVNKRRHDDRSLLHVVCLNPIEDVLIRVVRSGVIFDLVLNELKSRQPNPIERQVVRATGVGDRQCVSAHVFKRR